MFVQSVILGKLIQTNKIALYSRSTDTLNLGKAYVVDKSILLLESILLLNVCNLSISMEF